MTEKPTIVGINGVFIFYASYCYKHRQWVARSPILAFIWANLVPRRLGSGTHQLVQVELRTCVSGSASSVFLSTSVEALRPDYHLEATITTRAEDVVCFDDLVEIESVREQWRRIETLRLHHRH
jgi:hypothetical protein